VDEFQLSAESRDGVAIVKAGGYLDVTTRGELDERLTDARRQQNWVILDLTDVRFLDTSSIAVIVSHWKKLEARGGKLMLAGAQQRYVRALWITGLASRMSLYDDVGTAIAAAGSARAAGSGD
jgi:stage II sporulation protein AA (anti-sigma F factor antagonist)